MGDGRRRSPGRAAEGEAESADHAPGIKVGSGAGGGLSGSRPSFTACSNNPAGGFGGPARTREYVRQQIRRSGPRVTAADGRAPGAAIGVRVSFTLVYS